MNASTAIGSLMVIVAGFGYATVADDFRHLGEFFAVSGILVSGLAFLASGIFPKLQRYLALRWISAGVAVGLLFGTMTDKAALGFGIGVSLGLIVAILLRTRAPADSTHRT